MHYCVIGATSWGLTLGNLLASNDSKVTVLTRTDEEALTINYNRGLERFPELVLSSLVTAVSSDFLPADLDGLIVAIPAQNFRVAVTDKRLPRNISILSATKGIESGTLFLMNEILEDAGWEAEQISVISGPNFAREIVKKLPALAVVASNSNEESIFWQKSLSTEYFRVYTSSDVIGVGIAGALKNVIAIAAGTVIGMGFGNNTCSALLTRGLAEITRLGKSLGASSETFLGLAGVGDLAASCFSPLSRNFQLGQKIAEGRNPSDVIKELGEVVEGYTTTAVALELAKKQKVDMPVTAGVLAVLEGVIGPGEAVQLLLNRDLKSED